jgi:hypothetical protein
MLMPAPEIRPTWRSKAWDMLMGVQHDAHSSYIDPMSPTQFKDEIGILITEIISIVVQSGDNGPKPDWGVI